MGAARGCEPSAMPSEYVPPWSGAGLRGRRGALTLPARGYADYPNEGGARNSLIRFSRALFPSASASPIVSKECWQRSKTWSPSHRSQRNRVWVSTSASIFRVIVEISAMIGLLLALCAYLLAGRRKGESALTLGT